MLKRLYRKFGVGYSVVFITTFSVVVSVSITSVAMILAHKTYDLWFGIFMSTLCPVVVAVPVSYFCLRLLEQIDRSQQERKVANEKLEAALSEVKELSGLLPICSSCKKVRDDQGYWGLIESYIERHSKAKFTHGLCPECAQAARRDIEQNIKRRPV